MRIAFFSNIYSNIYALDAVLKELTSLSLDHIYCLGDIIGYLPFSNETISRLKERNISSIAGDIDLAMLQSDFGQINNLDYFKCLKENSDKISEKNREFLLDIEISKNIKNNLFEAYIFHGYLDSHNRHLKDTSQDHEFIEAVSGIDCNIFLCGGDKSPFIKKVKEKIFINCGSVGASKDSGFADYMVVDFGQNEISVQQYRAFYDVDVLKEKCKESLYKELLQDLY